MRQPAGLRPGFQVSALALSALLTIALIASGCTGSGNAPVPGANGTGTEPTAAPVSPAPAAGHTPGSGSVGSASPSGTPAVTPLPVSPDPSGPPTPATVDQAPPLVSPGQTDASVTPRPRLPEAVRGIHVSGWVAGTKDRIDPILAWSRQAGINTIVLDLKAEDGRLSWNSDLPLAAEIGANTHKIGDLTAFVQRLHQDGFWVVGRVVCFQDPVLYRARPEFRVPGFDGQSYSFVRPMDPVVQQYQLDIARAAVQAGVDEIQFDYVRFSEKFVAGYNKDTTVEFRTSAINDFLKSAVATLQPMGALISADVFGLTTSVAKGDDMKIGQDYRQIAEIVDFISPMMYPSHYDRGTYGIDNPDASPYDTVSRSMAKALERSAGIPVAKHRPWIQDFTYPAAGYMAYGKAELEAQVRALSELGIHSFLLWDPNNRYPRHTDTVFKG